MLSHYPYDISIRMLKNNGKLSNKVQISPFFLVSTKTTNQPKRCSTVSPLSSWTSIKLLSSELVSSPHVCVHTELSSDYFCMENLGTLSPKLTLYWATLKKVVQTPLTWKIFIFWHFLRNHFAFCNFIMLSDFSWQPNCQKSGKIWGTPRSLAVGEKVILDTFLLSYYMPRNRRGIISCNSSSYFLHYIGREGA